MAKKQVSKTTTTTKNKATVEKSTKKTSTAAVKPEAVKEEKEVKTVKAEEAKPEAAKVKKVGLTATPYRMNGKGFTDLFEMLLCSWNMERFFPKGLYPLGLI